MKITFIFLMVLICVASACSNKESENLISPQKGGIVKEDGWQYEEWSPVELYSDTTSGNYNTQALILNSDTLIAGRWFKKIEVNPFAKYKISGYIKTINVVGEGNAGAGFRLGKFEFSGDTIFKGSTDWTKVEMEFSTEMDDSFMLELLLGKGGKAKGKVYFDNLRLEELSVKDLNPTVQIDLEKKLEPISPYIYGQFIEHMGKSIYGGMWAEMLEDRKFYYTPGTSKSPWITSVDTNTVEIDSSYSYSRGKLPVIEVKHKVDFIQKKLTLQSGENYVGRVVFKGNGIKGVTISLDGNKESYEIEKEDQFQKISFKFSSDSDTETGSLELSFVGSGNLTLAALSLMPEDNIKGYRPEVINLMKDLNSPIYRWPGGNFVSGYDWKDGIGDPDKRPTKFERAWNGLEYNDVGVHEFMELCEILEAEANIAVNTGLGTAELAADEVEYFNGAQHTKMGKWRAENGHPEPYNVKLWAVGNEMFGDWQLGHMPVEDYVIKHNKVAKAMWRIDPDIELIAVGFPGNWNDMMYENCAENMTYISEHFYKQNWHAGGLLTHVNQMPEIIKEVAEEHRRARREIPEVEEKNIKIAMDEWNYWYGPHVYGLLGTRYFLRDALGIAAGLNEFSRQSDIYYMANYAQTVNVIGAIKTTKTDAWLEGTGLVLKLYRNEFGTQPVLLSGNPEPLDVAATITEDGDFLTISVVNATHKNQVLKLEALANTINTTGTSFIISGENDMVYNDEENPARIKIIETELQISDNRLDIPRESAGIYKFSLIENNHEN